jgi:hypothetical protein
MACWPCGGRSTRCSSPTIRPCPWTSCAATCSARPPTSDGGCGWRRSTASPPVWPTPTRTTIEVYAIVHPERRRRGVGRALLRAALPRVVADGGTSLLGWTLDDAGVALCRRLGLTHRSDDRCSRVRVVDVDPDQQRRWIDDAPGRAAGYRLVGWVGVCPDEWAERLAAALAAMVDAPLDDIDWDPQVLPPAQLQARERGWDGEGFDIVTTLALAPDGSAAGASQLLASRLRPYVGRQGARPPARHRRDRDLQRRVEPAHAGDQRRDGLPAAPCLQHVAGPGIGRRSLPRPRPGSGPRVTSLRGPRIGTPLRLRRLRGRRSNDAVSPLLAPPAPGRWATAAPIGAASQAEPLPVSAR